jgi:glycosyltransferase involved in cell wall biosynthesis
MESTQTIVSQELGSKVEWPLISVVTCFLNVEQFLEESIQSVISQKYPNWELLLVDDGSTDKGTEIAKSFADKYPNIYYLQHPDHLNHGLSASRILALKHAKGEIVSFLDGDDIWTPDFLSNAFQQKQQYQVPIYCEATKYWFSWKFPDRVDQVSPVGIDGNRTYFPLELIYELYPLGKGASPCICAILVDKSTLEKHGGFNAAFKGMYEDQVFLSKMYLHENIYISSDCNNIYRQRHDSIVYTSRSQGTYLKDRGFFLEWFEGYLKGIKNTDKKLQIMLYNALFPYRYPRIYFIKEILPGKIKRKVKRIAARLKK